MTQPEMIQTPAPTFRPAGEKLAEPQAEKREWADERDGVLRRLARVEREAGIKPPSTQQPNPGIQPMTAED